MAFTNNNSLPSSGSTNIHHFYVFISPATRVSENRIACCDFARVLAITVFADFLQRTISCTICCFNEFARTSGKINKCLVNNRFSSLSSCFKFVAHFSYFSSSCGSVKYENKFLEIKLSQNHSNKANFFFYYVFCSSIKITPIFSVAFGFT